MTRDIVEQIALVSGKLLHRGTGLPLDGEIRFDSREGPVAGRVLEEGTFVVSGRPDFLFPGLSSNPVTFHLRLHADSGQFTQRAVDYSLSINVAAGFAFDAPIDQGSILLPVGSADIAKNLARTIRGLVTEAADPQPAIAGATVEILQNGVVTNSTATDGNGRFSFNDIVVLAPARIRVTEAVHKPLERQLLIDFHFSMHEELLRLVHV